MSGVCCDANSCSRANRCIDIMNRHMCIIVHNSHAPNYRFDSCSLAIPRNQWHYGAQNIEIMINALQLPLSRRVVHAWVGSNVNSPVGLGCVESRFSVFSGLGRIDCAKSTTFFMVMKSTGGESCASFFQLSSLFGAVSVNARLVLLFSFYCQTSAVDWKPDNISY